LAAVRLALNGCGKFGAWVSAQGSFSKVGLRVYGAPAAQAPGGFMRTIGGLARVDRFGYIARLI